MASSFSSRVLAPRVSSAAFGAACECAAGASSSRASNFEAKYAQDTKVVKSRSGSDVDALRSLSEACACERFQRYIVRAEVPVPDFSVELAGVSGAILI